MGSGFSGGSLARAFTKLLNSAQKTSPTHTCKIILIDKNPYTVFTADIYEVATAFNQKMNNKCLTKLRETVATPITHTINPKTINFLQDEVTNIIPKKNLISLKKSGPLSYDYLAVCLGSAAGYFNIPGLEKYSFPLKTIQDAIKINCHLDQYFHKLSKSKSGRAQKHRVEIVVGGGGATGVETIAELSSAIKKLCKKYNYPEQKIRLNLIEAYDKLGGFGAQGTAVIKKHFQKMGILIHLNTQITKVKGHSLEVKSQNSRKKIIHSDFVIWTGGIQVNPIVTKTIGDDGARGGIKVNQFLQSEKWPNIFAAGDSSFCLDPANALKPLPMLATIAMEQGPVIAGNIFAAISKKPLKKYWPKVTGLLVPIGRSYALYQSKNRLYKGHWVYLLRRLFSLQYCLSILPPVKAYKKWRHGNKIFITND